MTVRYLAALALTTAVGLVGPVGTAHAAAPVPPTPTGLTRAVEAAQPYVGQTTCDPVAKPGVAAFRELLLRTYPGSGSLGIVLDCGAAGQTEHKEGRAFDWAVSINSAQQVSQVNTVMTWLTQPDQYGNAFAMARRLGIMYMIWNSRMWRSYGNGTYAANMWSPYAGSSRHTDHVHFSFGWNGAQKATSFWRNGAVAPVYTGPTRPPGTTLPPVPVAVPVIPSIRVSNAGILAAYGQSVLAQGSTGAATVVLQKALQITADGDYGPQTVAAVTAFQAQQRLPVTGRWSPVDWQTLFPVPAVPPTLEANTAVLRDFGQLTLSTGASGAAVATVQRALGIDADGSYGPQTVGAVTTFQREQELPVTGIWGVREWPVMFPTPVPTVPLAAGVLIAGGPRQSPAYDSQFAITGAATAGALVTLHFRKAGDPVGEYAIVRTLLADDLGRWSRPILANTDYRYYATTDSGRSETILNTPSPTVDGPAERRVPRGLTYRLTGHGQPGSTILLHFHGANMAPGDYSVVRPVTVGADGAWNRPYLAGQDYRLFASRIDGTTSGLAPILVMAR